MKESELPTVLRGFQAATKSTATRHGDSAKRLSNSASGTI